MRKLIALMAAVAAIGVMAVSAASASAFEWTKEGSPLAANAGVTFTGSAAFTGGVTCNPVEADITLIPGDKAKVNTFEPETSATADCQTTGLLALIGCEVEAVEPLGLPWDATIVGANKILIEEVEIRNKFVGCEVTAVTIKGDVTATADNGSAISSVSLSGTLESSLGGTTEVSGTLGASPAGVYGIQ